MFPIWKNGIIWNPLEILWYSQNELIKRPANTLYPLSLNVNNVDINSNICKKKVLRLKKRKIVKKIDLKFRNPKLNNFLQNNIYKISTICNSHVNKTVLEQVKVAVGLWLHAFQFFEKQKLCKQSSRKGTL